ncbi:MAG: hypothetical protein ABEJ36_04635 [Candidatus Nanosalina sp.]
MSDEQRISKLEQRVEELEETLQVVVQAVSEMQDEIESNRKEILHDDIDLSGNDNSLL